MENADLNFIWVSCNKSLNLQANEYSPSWNAIDTG
jgi:hypothetical protein